MCHTNALCARGTEVGGDDALDTGGLGCTDDVLLVVYLPPGSWDEENIDAVEGSLQFLDAILHVPEADFNARGA